MSQQTSPTVPAPPTSTQPNQLSPQNQPIQSTQGATPISQEAHPQPLIRFNLGSFFKKFSHPASNASKKSANDVNNRSEKILKISTIFIVFLLVINFLILFFISSKVKQLKVIKEQIITTQNQSLDLENTVSFLNSQESNSQLIKAALPGETELQTEFIETMEYITQQSANASSIKFSALAPTGSGLNKYIPFVVNLTTDMPNFQQFLKQIEKLPFIVEVTSIQSTSNESNRDVWDFTVAARVYVREPFKLNETTNQPLSIPIQ